MSSTHEKFFTSCNYDNTSTFNCQCHLTQQSRDGNVLFLRQFILITTNIYCCRNGKSNNVSWTDGVVVWEMGFLIKASKCKKYANSWSLLATISSFAFEEQFIRFTFRASDVILSLPKILSSNIFLRRNMWASLVFFDLDIFQGKKFVA